MIPFTEYTILAGIIIILISIVMISYAFVRVVKRIKYMNIPLDRIQPYFSYGSPMKTGYVECCFQINGKKNTSYVSEVVPLNYFIGSDDGFIIFDINIDLPVLYITGARIIGEEAIEHFLLQKKMSLAVKFVSGIYRPGEYDRGSIPSEKLF